MPIKVILLVVAIVLFVVAALIYEYPSTYAGPKINIGWLASAFFAASFLV